MIVVAMVVLKAIWAQETVTVDNFVRAETDMTLKRYVDQGAFGKLLPATALSWFRWGRCARTSR